MLNEAPRREKDTPVNLPEHNTNATLAWAGVEGSVDVHLDSSLTRPPPATQDPFFSLPSTYTQRVKNQLFTMGVYHIPVVSDRA
jgi:hypothetical protein